MNIPALDNHAILPRHQLLRHDALTPRRETPAARAKRLVQYPPVLDLGKIKDAIGLDLDIPAVYRRKQDLPLFLRERNTAQAMVRASPVVCGDALNLGRHVAEAMGEGALAGGGSSSGGVAGCGHRGFFSGEGGGDCSLGGCGWRFVG